VNYNFVIKLAGSVLASSEAEAETKINASSHLGLLRRLFSDIGIVDYSVDGLEWSDVAWDLEIEITELEEAKSE